MKLTLIRKDQKNQMHLSTKTMDNFIERIKTDTKSGDVERLRQSLLMSNRIVGYSQMHKLPVVYPLAELARDANDNLVMRSMNGVVLLSISNVRGQEAQEHIKQLAMSMPATLAAFVGSSGASVKVLVRVSRPDGTLPQAEDEANTFLRTAFGLVKSPYQALLGMAVADGEPTVKTGFRMTCDPQPLYNPKAVPFNVTTQMVIPSAQPVAGEQQHTDYDLYTQYENLYKRALEQVWSNLPEGADAEGILAELVRQLCLVGFPEEEAVTHIWAHYKYKTPQVYTEERIRAVTGAVYAETKPRCRQGDKAGSVGQEIRQLIDYLQHRFVFRYNTIMGYTEYRPNSTWFQDWQPVDERVINGFTTDARLAGLHVWDKDVKRYVMSDKIRLYNPVEAYLYEVQGKWDGKDHISKLAATVPTDNPHWPRWFRTWLLAMVAQWKGYNRRYGNSVAPLLISSQGYCKSTFCRSLLPDELQWGYTDNLSLDEKRPVLQAMSQMLLINLDEFNQISARTQEGFLKNVIQLARVKAKRPYGKHIEDFPRLASFIATTNMADVLADPSGNRRFIGVELTGPIDVSVRPNHEQIYAQAQALIERGEPYWFDDHETKLIMRHNRQFQLKTPAEQYFHELFEVASKPTEGRWLTAAGILYCMKKAAGSALNQVNIIAFGRMLTNIEGMQRRRSSLGVEYLVKEK